MSFKERRYQCPNYIKVSQQVLEELELSKKDTTEINDNPKKKVNTIINNNIDDNNTKNEKKLNNRNNDDNQNNSNNNNNNNNNNSKKQTNELNINETIEERLTKLESKVKHMLIKTCEI